MDRFVGMVCVRTERALIARPIVGLYVVMGNAKIRKIITIAQAIVVRTVATMNVKVVKTTAIVPMIAKLAVISCVKWVRAIGIAPLTVTYIIVVMVTAIQEKMPTPVQRIVRLVVETVFAKVARILTIAPTIAKPAVITTVMLAKLTQTVRLTVAPAEILIVIMKKTVLPVPAIAQRSVATATVRVVRIPTAVHTIVGLFVEMGNVRKVRTPLDVQVTAYRFAVIMPVK